MRCADQQRTGAMHMKSVYILLRHDCGEDAPLVHVWRQRELDQDAIDARVVIQGTNASEDILLDRVGWKLVQLGKHTSFLAGKHLVPHISTRCGIVTDDDDRQAGAHAVGGEGCDGNLELCAEGGGVRLSINDAGGHAGCRQRSRRGAKSSIGCYCIMRYCILQYEM